MYTHTYTYTYIIHNAATFLPWPSPRCRGSALAAAAGASGSGEGWWFGWRPSSSWSFSTLAFSSLSSLSKVDDKCSAERFEPTTSQSTVSSPPPSLAPGRREQGQDSACSPSPTYTCGGEVRHGATSGVLHKTCTKKQHRRWDATWCYIGCFVRDI